VHHGEGTPAQPAQNLQGKLWLIFCTIQQKISCTIQQDKVLAHFFAQFSRKTLANFLHNSAENFLHNSAGKTLANLLHNSAKYFLHNSAGKAFGSFFVQFSRKIPALFSRKRSLIFPWS
jgi:hypothetical protein